MPAACIVKLAVETDGDCWCLFHKTVSTKCRKNGISGSAKQKQRNYDGPMQYTSTRDADVRRGLQEKRRQS